MIDIIETTIGSLFGAFLGGYLAAAWRSRQLHALEDRIAYCEERIDAITKIVVQLSSRSHVHLKIEG